MIKVVASVLRDIGRRGSVRRAGPIRSLMTLNFEAIPTTQRFLPDHERDCVFTGFAHGAGTKPKKGLLWGAPVRGRHPRDSWR